MPKKRVDFKDLVQRIPIERVVDMLGLKLKKAGAQLAEVRQIFPSGDAIFAVARSGLYRMNSHGSGWQRALEAGNARVAVVG